MGAVKRAVEGRFEALLEVFVEERHRHPTRTETRALWRQAEEAFTARLDAQGEIRNRT